MFSCLLITRIKYHVSCVFGSPNPVFPVRSELRASRFCRSRGFSRTQPPRTVRMCCTLSMFFPWAERPKFTPIEQVESYYYACMYMLILTFYQLTRIPFQSQTGQWLSGVLLVFRRQSRSIPGYFLVIGHSHLVQTLSILRYVAEDQPLPML
jgi:hypothetical protein